MDQTSLMMIVIVVVMIGFMWWQSRKQKQRQQQQTDWRTSLAPGEEVATVSGLLGKVKEVDAEHDQIVIDSEGSLSRWRIQAITKPPVVPAYVSDDDVDEQGNPLPKAEDTTGDVTDGSDTDAASDASAESSEASAPAETSATAEDTGKTVNAAISDSSNGPIESEK
ncbi:MAG: preprotein translocase subunit YajC [Bifidobacteriaceae bacterium]|nr:preprotein translocase subunit YajC [Bifidobacteriaceae bacterium]MCI1915166.1 preprotein translocase subunit YajC [Bifidobacteriaceae bacterium]